MGASLLALAKSIYQGLFMVCLVINGKRGNPHMTLNITTSKYNVYDFKHNNIKFGDCGMEIPESWMPMMKQNRNIAVV